MYGRQTTQLNGANRGSKATCRTKGENQHQQKNKKEHRGRVQKLARSWRKDPRQPETGPLLLILGRKSNKPKRRENNKIVRPGTPGKGGTAIKGKGSENEADFLWQWGPKSAERGVGPGSSEN